MTCFFKILSHLPFSTSQFSPDAVLEDENRPWPVATVNLAQPPRGRPESDGLKTKTNDVSLREICQF